MLYRKRLQNRLLLLCSLALFLCSIALSVMPVHAAAPGSSYSYNTNGWFDACAAPNISTMQAWWPAQGKYWSVGVYIGGSNRACAQPNLTASWVSQVYGIGWNLVPTWVGLQPPCSTIANKFSSNTGTADAQGVAEADAAANAAISLGFAAGSQSFPGSIIIYDLEAFSPASQSCRDATKAFISAWDRELHIKGFHNGVYGTPCNSFLTDYVAIANVPDIVWMRDASTTATVWNISACVNNTLWVNDQRHRQFSFNHNETFGGFTVKTDSNCADSYVAGSQFPEFDPPGTNEANSITEDGSCPGF